MLRLLSGLKIHKVADRIDITSSEFVKENNIVAEKVIATIVVNSNRSDKAKAVLKAIK